jgi:hypothetical protein
MTFTVEYEREKVPAEACDEGVGLFHVFVEALAAL